MRSRLKGKTRLLIALAVALIPLTILPAAMARTEAPAVTLKLWIMNNGPEPVRDTERIVAPFERSTGINVDVELVGWDVQYQRITNAAISGEAPDVTQAGTTQVPYFAALRGFENLQSRVSQIGGKGAYAPGVWSTTQVVGRNGVWGCRGLPRPAPSTTARTSSSAPASTRRRRSRPGPRSSAR